MSDEQLILAAVRSGIEIRVGSSQVHEQLSIEALRKLFTMLLNEIRYGNA